MSETKSRWYSVDVDGNTCNFAIWLFWQRLNKYVCKVGDWGGFIFLWVEVIPAPGDCSCLACTHFRASRSHTRLLCVARRKFRKVITPQKFNFNWNKLISTFGLTAPTNWQLHTLPDSVGERERASEMGIWVSGTDSQRAARRIK